MDIRISAYSPASGGTTVTSFGATSGAPAAVAVQNAAQSNPVSPVAAASAISNNGAADAFQMLAAPNAAQNLQAQSEGRGKLVDIYA